MPGMYSGEDFDLAGFSVGAMNRGGALPSGVVEGDVLLGLASNGVHSNGYSLVRKIVEVSGLGWEAVCPWGEGTIGEALLAPTELYVNGAVAAIRADVVHAFAHITGGGLTENIPRAVPDGLGVAIDLGAWRLPAVFGWLAQQGGMEEAELLKTFNCGLGMVAIVPADNVAQATACFVEAGHRVTQIGHVIKGQGVAYQGSLL